MTRIKKAKKQKDNQGGKTNKRLQEKTSRHRQIIQPLKFESSVIAIDPGTRQSAIVTFDPKNYTVLSHDIRKNAEIVELLEISTSRKTLVIEMISCMGQIAGADLFETCVWIGRFIQAYRGVTFRIRRVAVKHHLNGKTSSSDAQVRQTVIDRFSGHLLLGGGKTPEIGITSNPGPLHGVRKDEWQALALAIAFCEIGPGDDRVSFE